MWRIKPSQLLLFRLCDSVLSTESGCAPVAHADTRPRRGAESVAFGRRAGGAVAQSRRAPGHGADFPFLNQVFGRTALPANLRLLDLIVSISRP